MNEHSKEINNQMIVKLLQCIPMAFTQWRLAALRMVVFASFVRNLSATSAIYKTNSFKRKSNKNGTYTLNSHYALVATAETPYATKREEKRFYFGQKRKRMSVNCFSVRLESV